MARPVLVSDPSVAVFGALPDWAIPSTSSPDSYMSIDASSEAAGGETPAANLLDGQMTTWWQSASGYRKDCEVRGYFLGTLADNAKDVGAIGLNGARLSPHARIRYRMRWDGDDIASRVRLAPNAVITQTAISGSLTDINDDPNAPGGTHMLITGGGSVLELGWATPSGFEQGVDGCHSFRLRFQNTGTSSLDLLGAKLRESGVDRENLLAGRDGTTKSITIAAGADIVIELVFSPASLTDRSGANLELRLEFQAPTGGEGRIRAVDLHYESTLPTVEYYDTGLQWAWSTELLTLLGGSLLTKFHPSETWVRSRTFAHAVRIDGEYANVEGVGVIAVEIHDPWEAFVRAAMLQAGPAVPIVVLEGVSHGARGRQLVGETSAGTQVLAHNRGRGRSMPAFKATRSAADHLHRFLGGGRSAGIPFLYLHQPAGETYFHGRPLVVTTGDGDPPDLTQVHRGESGGLWTLPSLTLHEYW